MSESDSGPGRREVAYRLFAAEFDDADVSYSESDEERAPNYVVTPTGARVNRLFAVGVLTEIESVNPEMVRGRVVDPTGAFVTYAGQYQPDALAFLERAEPPAFLALSGKARTYEPEDGDRTYTSVRPESVAEVDADTRDRWVVTAAERTLDRVGIAAAAIESGLAGDELRAALSDAGVDDRLADGVALALEHYGTTAAYLEALRELAIDAVRVVAGEREEAGELAVAPDAPGGDAAALASLDLEAPAGAGGTAGETTVGGDQEAATGAGADHDPDAEATTAGTEPSDDTSDLAAAEGEPDAIDPGPTETEPIETEETEPETIGSGPTGTDPAADPAGGSAAEPEAGGGTDPVEPTGGDADGEAFDSEAFDPGEFELDEEERREVEAEFGTEFSTAGEVEPAEELGNAEPADPEREPGAGEADLEDEPETGEAAGSEPAGEPDPGAEAGTVDDDPETDAEGDSEGEPDDVDLETAVMDAMADLDDGDGADRDALVARVAEARGVDSEAVEGAIREALMSGRCYEPADGTLKPI